MIKWPKRALGAVVKLFEPLQDIDVYVEDANDEVFYTHLLKRVAQNKVRIARVFSCGCRQAVIDNANSYDTTKRPALFIVDGDFEWVLGEPPPSSKAPLYRLNAYCIENLIVCETAFLNLVMEEAVLSEEDAQKKLNFQSLINTIKAPLIDLFSAFATSHKHCPSKATVSKGVGRLCSKSVSSSLHKLDTEKVKQEQITVISDVAKVIGESESLEYHKKVVARAESLSFPLDIVSGKDFLLPLLDFHLHSLDVKVKRKPLRLKLALHCKLDRFLPLLDVMEQVASGTTPVRYSSC